MRFLILLPASPESEAGVMPSDELMEEMSKFNEELTNAGIMLAAEGLHPSSKGAKVRFDGAKREVIDGPFTESKELVAGFWIWQCRSREEAIEWAKRIPNPTNEKFDVEIRQIAEWSDFGELAEKFPEVVEKSRQQKASA
jgi:hypothetical protein